MEKKTVRNNMSNSLVTVAHHSIAPLSTKDVFVKHLTPWLAKGGQRLVDAGKISIYEVGADVPVTVLEPEAVKTALVPETEDETTVTIGPDEGVTFDGQIPDAAVSGAQDSAAPGTDATNSADAGGDAGQSDAAAAQDGAAQPEAGAPAEGGDKPAAGRGKGKNK